MNEIKLANRSGGWWEDKGFQTMVETRNLDRAKAACGLLLLALEDELKPRIAACAARLTELKRSTSALASQLYDRHTPISDTGMIAQSISAASLMLLTAIVLVASAVGNVMTLISGGWNLWTCIIVGLIGTAFVTAMGQMFHARVLAARPRLETLMVVVMAALTVWALIDFGRGRGAMTALAQETVAAESFVDRETDPVENEAPSNGGGAEAAVTGLFSKALTTLTVAADIAVGVFLGVLMGMLTDGDFAGWRRLRNEKREIPKVQHEIGELLARVATAKKRCAAGILRASHHGDRNHPPYLAAGVAMILLAGAPATAQDVRISRLEVILLDVSGSVAQRGTRENFDELLAGVKQLLRTEPSESRTWTLLISTDSFGGVNTLVRGWTPSASGVFVERLNAARRQLVASFEQKAAGLTPSAAGTDIFGAIARAKALFDSEPGCGRCAKDLYLFTDGIHETGFSMPALLPTGVENMMSVARASRLLVPLDGVRVHVLGASTSNLTPQSWTAAKAFWTAVFREAGAELVIYSPETNAPRR